MQWKQRSSPGAGRLTGLTLIAALLSATPVAVAREQAVPGQWDSFAADLTIRHQRVTADGRPEGVSPPAMVLRIERRRAGGHWRTTLDVTSTEPTLVQSPAGRQSLDNPFAVARLEFQDGAPPRMYDRRGRLIQGPTPADISALGLPAELRKRDWNPEELIVGAPGMPGFAGERGPAAGLVSLVSERAARRNDLERRYGMPVGQVRGLDRFLHQSSDSTQELLVDPETALPVELNVADRGELVRHATLDYERLAGTALLRRRLRNEQAVAEPNGMRLVTEIELTNVRLTEGGR
jgi:hypothetical protein